MFTKGSLREASEPITVSNVLFSFDGSALQFFTKNSLAILKALSVGQHHFATAFGVVN